MKSTKHSQTHSMFAVILLVLLTFGTSLHAQMPHIVSSFVSPQFPKPTDSILIIDTILTPTGSSFRVNSTVSINGNKIDITYCYKDTTGFIGGGKVDTAIIGLLPEGVYHYAIYTRLLNQTEPPYCDSLINRDSIKLSFTVGMTNAINELSPEQISFSPNPVNNTLHLQTSLSHFSTQILDATGRTISINIDTKEIDVSTLPSGIYLFRLQHEQGNVVRRFVKE